MILAKITIIAGIIEIIFGFGALLLQIEEYHGTNTSLLIAAIVAMASVITVLWLAYKAKVKEQMEQYKQSVEAQKETDRKMQDMYDKAIEQWKETSIEMKETVKENTRAINENTSQTKLFEQTLDELRQTIRDSTRR